MNVVAPSQIPRCFALLISALLLNACSVTKSAPTANASTQVILKLDDLWNENDLVHPGWSQTFEFLNDEGVTATIGIVCESLEGGSEAYFQWILERHAEGHEIWHHGYCHCKPTVNGQEKREFRGTDYAYQLGHLTEAQRLAREKLGITLRSFGAPYNATDSSTARALEELPEIKVWMYKETKEPTTKYLLNRIPDVNIEYPVHEPDFEKLRAGFEKHRGQAVLVIQGHPRSWVSDPNRMEEFKQIVRYLKREGVSFTTPYAYYLSNASRK